MNKLRIVFAFSLMSLVVGCAATKEQKHLEMLASNRASIIASELPLEHGPLSVLRANSNRTTIELMMVYNSDHKDAKPIEQVIENSFKTYCSHSETRNNLQLGLSYRVKMVNTRGQLLVDQLVDKESCSTVL